VRLNGNRFKTSRERRPCPGLPCTQPQRARLDAPEDLAEVEALEARLAEELRATEKTTVDFVSGRSE
jgi:hypothetical protein